MKNQINLNTVIKHYNNTFANYGDSPQGANWKDGKSQSLRFKILLDGIGINNINDSVIADLGCGTGAFLDFLISEDICLEKYIGYDVVQNILDFSEEKFKILNTNNQWIKSEKPTLESDYIISSGIFNVKLDNDDDAWLKYILTVVNAMHFYAQKGYGFNLFRDKVKWKSPELYYANPNVFKEYCQNLGAKTVSLFENYGLYEWTIVVEK